MARSKSILNLQGTFQGITFVNSRTYRKHVRAARGTYKKAEVNEAFRESSKKLIAANPPAQILRDAIARYHPDLAGSRLWTRLLTHFRKQLKETGSTEFTKISAFEIHKRHPFHHLLSAESVVSQDPAGHELVVCITYGALPNFDQVKYVDGYRLGAIGIFPDLRKQNSRTTAAYSDIIPVDTTASPLTLHLAIPEGATEYVVCIKIEGCMKGVVNNHARTQGMTVVGAGLVDRGVVRSEV